MNFRDVMLDPVKRAAFIAESRQRSAELRAEMQERREARWSGETVDPMPSTSAPRSSRPAAPPAAASDAQIRRMVEHIVAARERLLLQAIGEVINEARVADRQKIRGLEASLKSLRKEFRQLKRERAAPQLRAIA